ncbi:MAG: TonB-dependent receptor plug domain-containing protein [Bacteroidota bacterium]
MKTLIYLCLPVMMICCFSCSSTSDATGSKKDKENTEEADEPYVYQDLTDYLRNFSGVTVTGSGRNARVTIRGSGSVAGNTSPIFVVDGLTLSGGLSQAYDLVNVENIKSLRVLRRPSETAVYGVRGANGVIKITLKD